jgi:uroporphyrinogen-III synthase
MRRAIRDNDQRAADSVLMLKNGVREQSESLLARKSAWQLGCIAAVIGRATRQDPLAANSL